MKPTPLPASAPLLPLKSALPLAALAVVSFHLAFAFSACSFLIAVYLFCFFALTHLATSRQAFYTGLVIGLLIYVPHLTFFKLILGPGAAALWVVLAVFPGLFLLLGRACLVRFGPVMLAFMAPFLWTGLEFFRSELYYLRFSWLSAGYAFSNAEELRHMANYGVYGIGFVIMAGASIFYMMPRMSKRTRMVTVLLLLSALLYPIFEQARRSPAIKTVRVAGVQMEFPSELEIKLGLEKLIKQCPEADLLVLSEYTFSEGPVPDYIKTWCRDHKKYLVAGGKDPAPNNFYNTAYVVDPSGEVIFRQVKNVPIQFMKDGLPATEQKLWDSPWGKLGFAVCYDASYRRVIDELVRQGAQGLIFPTMDVSDWGEAQHRLHARIVPMRAAEYRLPIFRLCSSGISQIVDRDGVVKASAPFPGDLAVISGTLELPAKGRLPMDRWGGPFSAVMCAVLASWLASAACMQRRKK